MSRPAASQAEPGAPGAPAAMAESPTDRAYSGGGIVYRLARALSDLPDDLKLRNVEWGVLLAVTGEHTAAQIGQAFGLGEAERRTVFTRLTDHGLVAERALSYDEYLRARASTGGDEDRSLASFLRAGVAMPGDSSPAASTSSASKSSDALGLTRPVRTRTETSPARPPSPPPVAFTPLQTPRPEAGRRLSLKVLMGHILNRSSDLDSGQLDVYRVFIRVDTKLLKRNGIDTLRFEDDRLVDDPELQQAIARSLERTLGMAMPSDVYV